MEAGTFWNPENRSNGPRLTRGVQICPVDVLPDTKPSRLLQWTAQGAWGPRRHLAWHARQAVEGEPESCPVLLSLSSAVTFLSSGSARGGGSW